MEPTYKKEELKELIRLALDCGYIANTQTTGQAIEDIHFGKKTNDSKTYLLFCEIHKWLMDKNDIYINVKYLEDNSYLLNMYDFREKYDKYELALKEGVIRSLRQLKELKNKLKEQENEDNI